jgi:hypothetical protein
MLNCSGEQSCSVQGRILQERKRSGRERVVNHIEDEIHFFWLDMQRVQGFGFV